MEQNFVYNGMAGATMFNLESLNMTEFNFSQKIQQPKSLRTSHPNHHRNRPTNANKL